MKLITEQKEFPTTAHYVIVVFAYHACNGVSYPSDDDKPSGLTNTQYYVFYNEKEWKTKIAELNGKEVFSAFHVDAVAKITTNIAIELYKVDKNYY